METLYRHPQNNINLYGYLMDAYSMHLYHRHRDRLRSWCAWKPEIESAFRAATRGRTWAGLHIRRGDYIKIGVALPLEAYADTVAGVRKNLPVYVATDDPAVKKSFAALDMPDIINPLPDLYAYTRGDIFDFWMLQNAKVCIGGGSAFSWWASLLGRNNEYYAPPLTHLWSDRNAPPPIVRQEL